MDDVNSSDVECDPKPTSKWAGAGRKSIEQLLDTAPQDRLSSKKTVKQLSYEQVAPTSQRTKQLWVNRFESFRENTLKQSIKDPHTADDLIRFFDSILNQRLTRISSKPAPNDDLIWAAAHYLIEDASFKWAAFAWTNQNKLRLKSFVVECINKGRLTAGHWNKQTWIGFVTLSRMVRKFLEHAQQTGVSNWDQTITRCLSVVLIAALGCRSGDVARSREYTGEEYMQYQHIDLFLVDRSDELFVSEDEEETTPSLADLHAMVTIQYAKGNKNRQGDTIVKHLSVLLDPSNHHMCAISWLLVHALRHGMVEGGNTLSAVLQEAARRPDRRVVWTHPHRPVLAQFAKSGSPHMELDQAAGTNQVLASIKLMAETSGVLDRVYTHALRNGAARDAIHVPATSRHTAAKAVTLSDVGRLLGHNGTTLGKGITHRYTGDTSMDMYAARAESKVVHRREPRFAASPDTVAAQIRAPVTHAERQAVADSTKDFSRNILDARVRKQRTDVLRKGTVTEPRRMTPHPSVLLPSPLPVANSSTSASMRPPLAERSTNTFHLRSTNNLDVESPGTSLPSAPSDGQITALSQTIFGGERAKSNGNPDDVADGVIGTATELLLDSEAAIKDTPNAETQLHDSANRFITKYSRYNVVKSVKFAETYRMYWPQVAGSFEKTIATAGLHGNSRDDPTPFIFLCGATTGCSFQSTFEKTVDDHKATCGGIQRPRKRKATKVSNPEVTSNPGVSNSDNIPAKRVRGPDKKPRKQRSKQRGPDKKPGKKKETQPKSHDADAGAPPEFAHMVNSFRFEPVQKKSGDQ